MLKEEQGCTCVVGCREEYEEKHKASEVRADEEMDVGV